MKRVLIAIALVTQSFLWCYAAGAHEGERFEEDIIITDAIIEQAEYKGAIFVKNLTVENSVIRKDAFNNVIIVGNRTLKNSLIADGAFGGATIIGQDSIEGSYSFDDDDNPSETDKKGNVYSDDVIINDPIINAGAYKGATFRGNLSIQSVLIESDAFKDATIMGNLSVDAGVVGKRAFYNATLNGTIELGSTTRVISDSAFCHLRGNDLEITIPETVESVGKAAFYKTWMTGSLVIPETLKELGDYAFAYNRFREIKLNAKTKYNTRFDYTFGVPFGRYGDFYLIEPFSYSISLTEVEIPYDMDIVPSALFSNCKNLKKINFPANSQLRTIKEGAFYGCDAMEDISFPNPSSISVEKYAFVRLDYDKCHRRVFIPEQVDGIRIKQTVFCPDDTVFLWLDPSNVQPEVAYKYPYYSTYKYSFFYRDPWVDYGLCIDDWGQYGDESMPTFMGYNCQARPGTGVLYVPKGCKAQLEQLLERDREYYANTSAQYSSNCPYFLFFKEIREFIDLGYPNYALDLKGDLNGDGDADGGDVSILLEMVLAGGVTDTQKAVADLNGDGDVDGGDVSILLEMVLSGE